MSLGILQGESAPTAACGPQGGLGRVGGARARAATHQTRDRAAQPRLQGPYQVL